MKKALTHSERIMNGLYHESGYQSIQLRLIRRNSVIMLSVMLSILLYLVFRNLWSLLPLLYGVYEYYKVRAYYDEGEFLFNLVPDFVFYSLCLVLPNHFSDSSDGRVGQNPVQKRNSYLKKVGYFRYIFRGGK